MNTEIKKIDDKLEHWYYNNYFFFKDKMTKDDYYRESGLTAIMFSFHFDTLINGLLRNRDINKKILKYLYSELEEDVDYNYGFAYRNYNSYCESFKYPIIKKESDIWINYVNDTYDILRQIYNSILKFSIKLPIDIVVYRGLYLDSDFEWSIIKGFTSTSYNIDTAINIMIKHYENENSEETEIDFDRLLLLKIHLPKGTNIFTTNLCTIYLEHEIVITDEGKLDNSSITTYIVDDTDSEYLYEEFNLVEAKFIKTGEVETPNFDLEQRKSLDWGRINLEGVNLNTITEDEIMEICDKEVSVS